MRIHYIQHVPFEGLGHIGKWVKSKGHTLSRTALFADDPLPDLAELDFLIIMGGPMGVHDTVEYPWLPEEKRFIKRCILDGKKILGICLGAQLIADSIGGKVYKHQYKEIGWHSVTKVNGIQHSDLNKLFPQSFFAFHWHGDTYDLPPGAIHLAQSEACPNQAFFYPPATFAVQFHLETTTEGVESIIKHCGHELEPAPFIQNSTTILSKSDLMEPSNKLMEDVLDYIVGI